MVRKGTKTGPKDPLNVALSIIATALGVGLFFVLMHSQVQDVMDPAVFRFYMINSIAYTVAYLLTKSVLVTAVAHTMHNGIVWVVANL